MAAPLRPARGFAMALVATLLVMTTVACGDDDDGMPAVIGTDGADGADVATAEIVISGFAFTGPGTVPVGTTVIVQNADDAQHTWTSVDDVFDSGVMAGGDTFTFTFDEPGEYAYVCVFHPSMTGTIVVTG